MGPSSEREPAEALLGPVQQLIDKVGGVSPAARIAGVARNTADQWYKGNTRIPFAAVVDLARAAQVSLDQVAGGGVRPSAVHPIPGGAVFLTGPRAPDGFVPVPMLDIQASAGSGLYPVPRDGAATDMLAFREEWLRGIGLLPGRTEALTAVGDSMEPTIRDGDMLLVDRSIDRVLDNGIYVLVFGGAVLVKRIQLRRDQSVVLMSDNRVYPDEPVPADEVHDLVVEGRVRWFGRTI